MTWVWDDTNWRTNNKNNVRLIQLHVVVSDDIIVCTLHYEDQHCNCPASSSVVDGSVSCNVAIKSTPLTVTTSPGDQRCEAVQMCQAKHTCIHGTHKLLIALSSVCTIGDLTHGHDQSSRNVNYIHCTLLVLHTTVSSTDSMLDQYSTVLHSTTQPNIND